ncbi:MAG: Secreted and surface protein containing fasciclin-like repeats [uncultured Gemmatimonadaceae bacterium]|uniref:Secreted and surface protein containing fasciclin-like repeats n=1 Tax=uncultured Gemmatimonadaceae bacterium TaxID=246130 RepID=A0A6J4LZ78_9BACT|nr:MAG: Secreted and surface protein containing fasciclin-like repeats [uncultured Gemmatimonadaceae bacterium]
MIRTIKLATFAAVAAAAATPAFAQGTSARMSAATVTVGGQAMLPSRDIVDNAVNSADHTTLVAAVKAAGLVETLKGAGPFTVFAPTNAAFNLLPAGTVETLVKPESKDALTKILTYHVVAGRYDAARVIAAIKAGKGSASLKTVAGGTLTARMNGARNVVVVDEAGNAASISTYDVAQSNGVIHVVDRVLMPK